MKSRRNACKYFRLLLISHISDNREIGFLATKHYWCTKLNSCLRNNKFFNGDRNYNQISNSF